MKSKVLRCVTYGLAGLTVAVIVGTGCATTDSMYRGTVRIINPDKMTLQGTVKWMNPMPNLRPVSPDKRVVYLRVRNVSGSPLPDLTPQIRAGFEQAGYRVTTNPDEAWYTVTIDLRYFGENRKLDAGGSMLAGAAFGALPGAIIGHNVGSGHTAEGAIIGAAVGAAVGKIMANRNKMVEYDLVIDVRIGERVQGGVKTVRKSSSDAAVTHTDVRGAEGGRARAGSGEEQKVEVKEDFLFHENRLVAYAKRMALTPDEALPFLQQRLVAALSSVLP